MFKRSFKISERTEKVAKSSDRVEKTAKSKRLHKDAAKVSKLQKSFEKSSPAVGSTLTSPIITLAVGREGRLFAAHEDVLSISPFFATKGDYYPRLLHNKRKDSWELEDAINTPNPENNGGRGSVEATTYISSVGEYLLKDTVIYCAAEKYGLEELKRLALRKQGLQSGIEVATILRSARYAYDNTPDTDSRLRAHYLALIIRCRKTFKRSGTMQAEMESGGKLFFDLFVALCNHVDDIVDMGNSHSPKAI
ncbi:hypothetical protein B7463_g6006, partial [Scytalidium lignicola]